MTAEGDLIKLNYRAIDGSEVHDEAAVLGEDVVPPAPLRARRLQLRDGTEVMQLFPGRDDQVTDHDRLDSEILAGLRLAWLADDIAKASDSSLARPRAPASYPPQLSRLHGYEPDVAEPFALLYPYRGETVGTAGRRLLPAQYLGFQVSLLEGLRWLAAAGVAHRGISPATVRWDGENSRVQITGFSLATVLGAPREVVGAPPWAAPEQRVGQVGGLVTDRDDVWAAGRLMYLVLTGETLRGPDQLAESPGLANLLDGVFGPPEGRPTALELLGRLPASDPIPRRWDADQLKPGRERFAAARAAKYAAPRPAAAPPPGATASRPAAPPPGASASASNAAAPRPAGRAAATARLGRPVAQAAPVPATGWPPQPPARPWPPPPPAAPWPPPPPSQVRRPLVRAVLSIGGLVIALAVIGLIVGLAR
jgi:hypothetical protein